MIDVYDIDTVEHTDNAGMCNTYTQSFNHTCVSVYVYVSQVASGVVEHRNGARLSIGTHAIIISSAT